VASATFGSWTTSAPRGVRQVLAGTDRRSALETVARLTPLPELAARSVRRSEKRIGPPIRSAAKCRGTGVVPTDTPYVSRESRAGDAWDAWDAPGRIYTPASSTGGRKVTGSNPVAPMFSSGTTWLCRAA
jgi:hypothetical protein